MRRILYSLLVISATIYIFVYNQDTSNLSQNNAKKNIINIDNQDTKQKNNNLIYYNLPAIHIDKGTRIVIDLPSLDNYKNISNIYIYNCETKQNFSISIQSKISYLIEEDSSYCIYAITFERQYINLSNTISIEHELKNNSNNNEIIFL